MDRCKAEETIQALRICCNLQRHYEVILTENLVERAATVLADCIGSRPALIVSTPTVAHLYGRILQQQLKSLGLRVPMTVVPCTERSKTMRQVEHICADAYAHNLGRSAMLVGLGGGVCTDLVTMAASLIRRGISYIRIPTTLLGQVDAAIGIKGAVNTRYKKSALGCFYPPEAVFIYPFFLKTLPLRHLSSGVAEIIKVALVCDGGLFSLLEQHVLKLVQSRFTCSSEISRKVIWSSIQGLLQELRNNLYEDKSYERLMDFGHTFSPLLEARSRFRLSHGEAVGIDIALTVALASEFGWLTEQDRDRAVSVITASGLAIESELLTEELCTESFRETTLHRAGTLNLVLPTALGRAGFVKQAHDVPSCHIRSALAWLSSGEGLSLSRPGPQVHRRELAKDSAAALA